MQKQKQAIIHLLTTHYQLLLDKKERILMDFYMSDCPLPLKFGFGWMGPYTMRLGALLQLWERFQTVEG